MAARFVSELSTPSVLAAQQRAYGRSHAPAWGVDADELGPAEAEFLARRDSFYMATVSSSGWPYVQHRGGPAGFLKVLGPRSIGFADLRGNRQLVSTGNVASGDRVALILVDYPAQQRLKILGHAHVVDARDDAPLADALCPSPELRKRVERSWRIDVVGFDWNCPAYITPRFTLAEIDEHVAPLRARIADLERALAARGAQAAR